MDFSSFLSMFDTYDLICIAIVPIVFGKWYWDTTSKYTVLNQNLAVSNPFCSRHQRLSHDEVPYNGLSPYRSDRALHNSSQWNAQAKGSRPGQKMTDSGSAPSHSGEKFNSARGAEPQKVGSAGKKENELSQVTIDYMKMKQRFIYNNINERAVYKQANEQPKIPVSSPASVPKGTGSKSSPSDASDITTKANLSSNAAPAPLSGRSSPSKKKATSVSVKSQGWQPLF